MSILKKVLFPVMLAAMLAGVAFWLFPPWSTARRAAPPAADAAPTESVSPDPLAFSAADHPAASTGPAETPSPELPDDLARNEAYVEQRIAELQDLAMSGETDSLKSITSELTNRDPRIRQAAVDAAVQFGSPEAIPALRDAYTQADVPQEKITLQKAIDFLQLPSVRP